jgi:hypothetical protein
VVVEISPKAERFVDGRLTRRLVEIELSDTELPPRPHESGRPSVYFRVLATSPDTLRVELWDKGVFYGARRLGSHDVKELVARRIALAASALLRDMKSRRATEDRAAEEERRAREQEHAALVEARRWPAIVVEPGLEGGAVGSGDLLLAGPELAGQVRFRNGTRIGLHGGWLFGAVPAASGSAVARWLELGVSPVHAFRVSPGFDLGIGLTAAAAALHFTRVQGVDDISGQLDTWSARAALRLLAEPRLGPRARLSLGPEIGATLRRVALVDEAGERHRLGGLWLGVTLGVALDPGGRL